MRLKPLFVFAILFLLPATSTATTWEYITYGGYDSAVNSWTRVALIFSSEGYRGLFISVIVLGAIITALSVYIKLFMGTKSGTFAPWAVPVLLGMVIYAAFIVPKNKIVIYDELLNRGPQTVDGIPIVIATSAGILNKIEKGFVEIISTSSDPSSDYRENAGGTGWSIVDSISVANFLTPHQHATIKNYIHDCVFMELQRDGTNLSVNKIASGEQKYDTVTTESANHALFTVVHASASADFGPSGVTKTCQEASTMVLGILNSTPQNEKAVKAVCASRGFDVTKAASLNVCKNLIASILSTTFPQAGALGSNIYIAQKIMADAFFHVMQSSSQSVAISLLATAQTTSQFIGLGVHANNWIPVLKESLTAIAVGISPLVLLFMATPLAGRALSLVLGMFVWLAMWGITDAVVHSFGVDLAKQASSDINTSSPGMGLAAIYMWPGYAEKVAATFGALRWSGLMLASVMATMLIRFGGAALAMLAGSVAGMPQSSGAHYGSAIGRNAGGVLQSEILPTQTWGSATANIGTNNLMRGLEARGTAAMAGQATASLIAHNSMGTSGMINAVSASEQFSLGAGFGVHTKEMATGYTSLHMGTAQGAGSVQHIDSRGIVKRSDVTLMWGKDGRLNVIGANTELISAGLERRKEKSFNKVFSLMREALESKGTGEAYKIFKQHEKRFSAEEAGQISSLFSNLLEVTRGSGGREGHQSHMTKAGNFGYGFGGSADWGGGTSPISPKEGLDPKKTNYYSAHRGTAGANIGVNLGVNNSNTNTVFGESYQRSELTNQIARRLAESYMRGFANHESSSSGGNWAKEFLGSERYNEAAKAAREYRESDAISQSVRTNFIPMVIDRMAKELGGDFNLMGYDSYYKAYQKLVGSVYGGDLSTVTKYLDQEYGKHKLEEGLETRQQAETVIRDIKDTVIREVSNNLKPGNVPSKPVKPPVAPVKAKKYFDDYTQNKSSQGGGQ